MNIRRRCRSFCHGPLHACTVCVVLLMHIGLLAAEDHRDAIITATRQRQEALTSFFVEYRIVSKVLGAPVNAKKYLNVLAEVDETKAFAFKKNKRYFRLKRPVGTYTDIAPEVSIGAAPSITDPKAPPSETPEKMKHRVSMQTETAFDGATLRRREHDEKTAFIFGDGDLKVIKTDAQFFTNEYLLCAFHSLPDVFRTNETRADHRLPDLLETGAGTLRSDREDVDGHSCVVIDVNSERKVTAWCDPELNYAVRRWDSYDVDGMHRTWRYDLSDFIEVSAGFWFPRRCTRLRWATTAAPIEVRKSPLMQYQYEVLLMHANDVKDELFELAIPAGTEVVDFSQTAVTADGVEQPLMYQMPANPTELDSLVRKTRNIVEASSNMTPHRSNRMIPLILFNSILAVTLAVVIFRRKVSKR